MVLQQMPLIQEIQTDEWWQDVTAPMLERVRRRLRDLVAFIDKRQRRVIYTDFEDTMGDEMLVDLPGFESGTDLVRFQSKARAFLRAHADRDAIRKLRMNEPLTGSDLAELERILLESGAGTEDNVRRLRTSSRGLGLFVRSLVGLDREAAKRALAVFMTGKKLTAAQIEFVGLIVDHLTEHGVLEAARLYESPFTDITPHGPDGLFTPTQLDELLRVLDQVRQSATAA